MTRQPLSANRWTFMWTLMWTFMWCAMAGAALCSASTLRAAIIQVFPDGTGDYPSIQDALDNAGPGDEIVLGAGVYLEHDLVLANGVSITGQSGAPGTIIDAMFAGRCVAGDPVTGAPEISGVTFRNGYANGSGGLVLAGHNNARFVDCIFRDGDAETGGAVALVGASGGHSPRFTRCEFTGNRSTDDGGAAWTNGVGYFEQCTFLENLAGGDGGAVFSTKTDNSWMWLRDSAFQSNHASDRGGAVCSVDGDIFTLFGNRISGCVFLGNSAARGGAAFLDVYDAAVACAFFDNGATEAGGALYLVDIVASKEFEYFAGNLMDGNRAGVRGGAVVVSGVSGFFEMETSTLVRNAAPSGSHLWSDRGGAWGSLRGTILAFGEGGAAVEGSGVAEVTCSDLFDNAGGDFLGPVAGSVGILGNISEDPLFCGIDVADFTVQEDSPCLPSNPAGCPSGRMGAFGQGCGATTSVPDTEGGPRIHHGSWGDVKARFR